jgi:hypothetical protein
MRQALPVALLALTLAGAGCTGDDAASTTTTSVEDTITTTSTSIRTSSTTLPPLVDDRSIGYGFLLGAADQTVALSVEFTDHRAAARGDIPEVSVLPDSRWRVELHIGRNLFWGPGRRHPDRPAGCRP